MPWPRYEPALGTRSALHDQVHHSDRVGVVRCTTLGRQPEGYLPDARAVNNVTAQSGVEADTSPVRRAKKLKPLPEGEQRDEMWQQRVEGMDRAERVTAHFSERSSGIFVSKMVLNTSARASTLSCSLTAPGP